MGADVNRWTTQGPPGGAVQAIAIVPNASQTLFAAGGGGLFKATNGGASWTLVAHRNSALAIDPQTPTTVCRRRWERCDQEHRRGPDLGPRQLRTDVPGDRCRAIDPQTPATVYAATARGVFKTTNGGTSWVAMNTGFADLAAADVLVDPATPTTVYASGVPCGRTSSSPPTGVYKSIAGGVGTARQDEAAASG